MESEAAFRIERFKAEGSSLDYFARVDDLFLPIRCLFLESGLTTFRKCVARDHPNPPYNRVFILKSGRARITMSERAYELRGGRVYLLPISAPFAVRYYSGTTLVYFHLRVQDAAGLELFDGFREVSMLSDAQEVISNLVVGYETSGLPGVARWQVAIFELLSQFAISTRNSSKRLRMTSKYGELLAYIHEHGHPALTVAALARVTHTSISALSRGFHSEMGISLKNYITRLFMNRAREMLSATDLDAKQVAFEIGYDDPYYFYRVFRKHVGMTPRQYRRASRDHSFRP